MELMEAYDKALQDLCDHVGFVKEWISRSIEDKTKLNWEIIHDCKLLEPYRILRISNKDIHTDLIFDLTQLYSGEKLTMILVRNRMEDYKFFAIFSNDREIKNEWSNRRLLLEKILI